MRVLQLSKFSKGGLGDVRQLPNGEFDLYYRAMILLNRLERKAMEEERKKQEAKNRG